MEPLVGRYLERLDDARVDDVGEPPFDRIEVIAEPINLYLRHMPSLGPFRAWGEVDGACALVGLHGLEERV